MKIFPLLLLSFLSSIQTQFEIVYFISLEKFSFIYHFGSNYNVFLKDSTVFSGHIYFKDSKIVFECPNFDCKINARDCAFEFENSTITFENLSFNFSSTEINLNQHLFSGNRNSSLIFQVTHFFSFIFCNKLY